MKLLNDDRIITENLFIIMKNHHLTQIYQGNLVLVKSLYRVSNVILFRLRTDRLKQSVNVFIDNQ